MRYSVILTDKVKATLRRMPLALRREIGHKLFLLENEFEWQHQEVERGLATNTGCVGDDRALFELEGRDVTVCAVGNRKDHLSMSTAALKVKSGSANPTVATEIDKQIRRGKAVLRELKATLEDLEDRRELAAAKKRNRGKADTPLREAAKELGL